MTTVNYINYFEGKLYYIDGHTTVLRGEKYRGAFIFDLVKHKRGNSALDQCFYLYTKHVPQSNSLSNPGELAYKPIKFIHVPDEFKLALTLEGYL